MTAKRIVLSVLACAALAHAQKDWRKLTASEDLQHGQEEIDGGQADYAATISSPDPNIYAPRLTPDSITPDRNAAQPADIFRRRQ
jgi:hypothetical protein